MNTSSILRILTGIKHWAKTLLGVGACYKHFQIYLVNGTTTHN